MELLLCMSSKAASPTAANGINKKGGFNENDADTGGKRGKVLVLGSDFFVHIQMVFTNICTEFRYIYIYCLAGFFCMVDTWGKTQPHFAR